jgi:hypothetical protein
MRSGGIATYLLTYLLTYLRRWALLEELSVVQPLKNPTAFYGTRRFNAVFTRALHWSLSWAISIQSTMLGGSLVTTAWRVLRVRMEETPSSFGGQLRIYWLCSRGQPTRGGPTHILKQRNAEEVAHWHWNPMLKHTLHVAYVSACSRRGLREVTFQFRVENKTQRTVVFSPQANYTVQVTTAHQRS